MTTFAALKFRIETVQFELQAVQKDFKTMIKDQSIPLADRWSFWIKSPSDLKETDSSAPTFNAMGGEVSWYDDFNMERHESKYTSDLVNDLKNCIGTKPNKYTGEVHRRFMANPKLLDDLKEEILAMNLDEFTYDW